MEKNVVWEREMRPTSQDLRMPTAFSKLSEKQSGPWNNLKNLPPKKRQLESEPGR